MTSSIDVYVSKTFKTLHYCSVYQTDVKNSDVNIAMKNICSFLLPDHRLHLVQEIETCAFIDKVNAVPRLRNSYYKERHFFYQEIIREAA